MVILICSRPSGATALIPPGPAPPVMRSVEVLYFPKLRLNRAAAKKIAALGQHADDGRVPGEPAAGADLLFRVGVPVVEVEGQGRLRVRRNRYEHTLRGLAAARTKQKLAFVLRPVPSSSGQVITAAPSSAPAWGPVRASCIPFAPAEHRQSLRQSSQP